MTATPTNADDTTLDALEEHIAARLSVQRRAIAELDDTGILAALTAAAAGHTAEVLASLGADPTHVTGDHVHAFVHDDHGGFWEYHPVPEHLATRNDTLGRWEANRADVAHLLPS